MSESSEEELLNGYINFVKPEKKIETKTKAQTKQKSTVKPETKAQTKRNKTVKKVKEPVEKFEEKIDEVPEEKPTTKHKTKGKNKKKEPIKLKVKTRKMADDYTSQRPVEPGQKRELDLSQVKLKNPFKTKYKYESTPERLQPNVNEISHDHSIKQNMKKFKRPYFSPYVNSYECDIAFIGNNPKLKLFPYLFLININTKYLYILKLNNKDIASIKHAFEKWIYYGLRINSLRSDDESAIKSLDSYFKKLHIKTFHSSSKFTNKNRIVDRVIRTIRDMYYSITGDKVIDPDKQHNILQQLVTIYNNTIHGATGKKPAEMTYEDEYEYIDKMKHKLENVKRMQKRAGLLSLKNGDPIKVYLDFSKTNKAFQKKRGNFIYDATFIDYVNCNAKIKISENLSKDLKIDKDKGRIINGSNRDIPGVTLKKNEIVIPLYWIKTN